MSHLKNYTDYYEKTHKNIVKRKQNQRNQKILNFTYWFNKQKQQQLDIIFDLRNFSKINLMFTINTAQNGGHYIES